MVFFTMHTRVPARADLWDWRKEIAAWSCTTGRHRGPRRASLGGLVEHGPKKRRPYRLPGGL